MALLSVDPPGAKDMPACLYWGAVESQALAMNYAGKTADRTLRRLRLKLAEAGAIELVRPGARYRSPTWRVVTDPGYQDHERPMPWLVGGPPRPYLGGPPRP
jgi:hypothetical protein